MYEDGVMELGGELIWEIVQTNFHELTSVHSCLYRVKVPGGWLVSLFMFPTINEEVKDSKVDLIFLPDPNYDWENIDEWMKKTSKKN